MVIDNGASTGTYVHEVSTLTLRDVGKIDGTILALFKADTAASLEEAGVEMRKFIARWIVTEGHEFMFLYLYLYVDPKDTSKGTRTLGVDPLQLEAVKFTWEGCIGSAAAKLEARGQAKSQAMEKVSNPPKSGIGKSLESRKAPPFASYSDKTEEEQWAFIRAVTPSLTAPFVSVEEARALLGTLMTERGTSFLTSHGCLTAVSAEQLLGALMMEVEHVDCTDQMRSRIFCADRRSDESLLEFIDRVSDRHQLYCMAFPNASPDHVALLNRVIQCMGKPEYGVQMIMRQVSCLSEARERIRTLNLPSMHDKPVKGGRASGGIYLTNSSSTATTSSRDSASAASENVEMTVLRKQVAEMMRALTASTAAVTKLANQVKAGAGTGGGTMGGGAAGTDHGGGYQGGGHSGGFRAGGHQGDLAHNQCYECREYGHFGRNCEKRAARFEAEAKAREVAKAADTVVAATKTDFP